MSKQFIYVPECNNTHTMELYGFSVELPVQKQFGPVLAKCCCQYTEMHIVGIRFRNTFRKMSQPCSTPGAAAL